MADWLQSILPYKQGWEPKVVVKPISSAQTHWTLISKIWNKHHIPPAFLYTLLG